MSILLRSYLRILERHPWKTQAGTTGFLFAAGDALAQVAVEKRRLAQYDVPRTGRFLIFGLFVGGPALRGWYLTLERLYRGKRAAAVKMVATDQLLFAPAFCAVILSTMTYWREYSVQAAQDKLKNDYTTVLLANYKLWPAAQLLNFYFIPIQHRVLYVNFVALFWNTYIAYKSENQDRPDKQEES